MGPSDNLEVRCLDKALLRQVNIFHFFNSVKYLSKFLFLWGKGCFYNTPRKNKNIIIIIIIFVAIKLVDQNLTVFTLQVEAHSSWDTPKNIFLQILSSILMPSFTYLFIFVLHERSLRQMPSLCFRAHPLPFLQQYYFTN